MNRIYECTVVDDYGFPWSIDGEVVAAEIVAETAGKARYSYWRDLREFWQEIELKNIRVKSLSKRSPVWMLPGWEDRMQTANEIIKVIAKYGRHFLSENSDRRELVENPFIAHFTFDDRRELWYVDRYSRKHILVRLREWDGFSDGGTLRGIVEHLGDHIREGRPINIGYFQRGPKWLSGDGDYWGYGADMDCVAHDVSMILASQVAEAV